MIIDEYTPTGSVGPKFRQFIEKANKTVHAKDDDLVGVICGLTGTGKSNLGMSIQEIVVPVPRIEQIALTRPDLARAIDAELEAPSENRYLQYDEGKLSRREWNSEWSRELLELYHDVRGLNIFHVWCTAMPNLLDREFIKSRVGFFIFIYTKDEDKPRNFLLFTKNDLLRFLEQNNGVISMDLLKKYGKAHASMQSWFRQYNGPMKAAYLDKKESRMRERVKQFAKKWSGDEMSQQEAGQQIGVDHRTINRWLKDDFFVADRDYIINPTGVKKLTPEGLKTLENYQRIKMSDGSRALTPSKKAVIPPYKQYSNARSKETEGVLELAEEDKKIMSYRVISEALPDGDL